MDAFSRDIAPYYGAGKKRRETVDGVTLTEAQLEEEKRTKAELAWKQRQAEIEKQHDTLNESSKNANRAYIKAQREWRLSGLAAATSGLVAAALATGWFFSVTWAVATSFSHSRGGVFAFYAVALVVLSFLDGLALANFIPNAHKSYGRFEDAKHRREDASEALGRFEIKLMEEREERERNNLLALM